jgi:adenylate cyclase
VLAVRYRFNGYTLDITRGCLHGADGEVELRPKCFDALRCLVENAGRLISKEELVATVWRQAVVTDESLARCISDVRTAIADHDHTIIKTVLRRGYLFTAVVGRLGGAEPPQELSGAKAASERAVADLPSIAVLAFTNMSGDPEQEYLSDGITEDIITELSRFAELLVIARNSSFQYKGKSIDVRQVGRELGVRYVLEGSIRRAGDRIRTSAQLIDAVTGAHRWGERYDRELKDVFAVQDEVSRTIVAILVAHVNKAEAERTLLKPPATWQAYDFFMRASGIWSAKWPSSNVADVYEARRLLDRSIALDPDYARAYAALANTHLAVWLHPLDEDHLSSAALERALRLARKAVQLDPNLPIAHAYLGMILTYDGQHERSTAEFEKAMALNPNFTDWRFGVALVCAGEPARAAQVIETHMRYDPFYSPWALGELGLARYMLKEYSQALPPLRECASRVPDMTGGRVWLAANLAQLGQLDAAHAEAAEVLRINPKFTIDGTHVRLKRFKRREDAEHLLDGLRKAGLPET